MKIGRENNNVAWKIVVLSLHPIQLAMNNLVQLPSLGPTRMEYSRVISLIAIFSKDLTTVLTKLYQTK